METLSSKEHDLRNLCKLGEKSCPYFLTKDVQEFIKKCEELSVYAVHRSEGQGWGAKAIRIDDLKKLAGPKLTENST